MSTYIVVVLCCAFAVVLRTLKQHKALPALLQSAFGGVLGLLAVHISSMWGAALLTLNAFTFAVALFLGAPGVVGLLLMRLICVA